MGAPIAGPLSEISGRNPVYIVSYAAFILFVIGAALVPDIAGQLVLRFLAGACGSTSIVLRRRHSFRTCGRHWSRYTYFLSMLLADSWDSRVGPAVGGAIAGSTERELAMGRVELGRDGGSDPALGFVLPAGDLRAGVATLERHRDCLMR